MLTYSPSIVAASVKVLEESATPDVQCTFAPGSLKGGQIGELEETPGLSAGAWQMRPLSRGYVEAKSNRQGEATSATGGCHVIGKRRRRTRMRSITTMLRAISLSPMARRICCIRAVTSGSLQSPPRNRIRLGPSASVRAKSLG
jgi:hypothetical protein